jgi:hypothetical protein
MYGRVLRLCGNGHHRDLERTGLFIFHLVWAAASKVFWRTDPKPVTLPRTICSQANRKSTRQSPRNLLPAAPGKIEADGSIDRGAKNLPGNWESSKFNLPATLYKAIPKIGDFETLILMHNDAVVQGLSEVPFMQDVEKWGVFTIGTGLGNALFSNRRTE